MGCKGGKKPRQLTHRASFFMPTYRAKDKFRGVYHVKKNRYRLDAQAVYIVATR